MWITSCKRASIHIYIALHKACAVHDITMLFYHLVTVQDVNFIQQWGPAIAIKHPKPSVLARVYAPTLVEPSG